MVCYGVLPGLPQTSIRVTNQPISLRSTIRIRSRLRPTRRFSGAQQLSVKPHAIGQTLVVHRSTGATTLIPLRPASSWTSVREKSTQARTGATQRNRIRSATYLDIHAWTLTARERQRKLYLGRSSDPRSCVVEISFEASRITSRQAHLFYNGSNQAFFPTVRLRVRLELLGLATVSRRGLPPSVRCMSRAPNTIRDDGSARVARAGRSNDLHRPAIPRITIAGGLSFSKSAPNTSLPYGNTARHLRQIGRNTILHLNIAFGGSDGLCGLCRPTWSRPTFGPTNVVDLEMGKRAVETSARMCSCELTYENAMCNAAEILHEAARRSTLTTHTRAIGHFRISPTARRFRTLTRARTSLRAGETNTTCFCQGVAGRPVSIPLRVKLLYNAQDQITDRDQSGSRQLPRISYPNTTWRGRIYWGPIANASSGPGGMPSGVIQGVRVSGQLVGRHDPIPLLATRLFYGLVFPL